MTSRDMLDDMAFELGAKAGRTATKAFSHGDEILPEPPPAPAPPPLAYRVVHLTEDPDELLPETLYAIGENGHLWHVALVCPCGCGATIALNVLPDASPRWRLYESADGPTLSPSAWRTTGCRSHFILRRGGVIWCHGRPDDVGEIEYGAETAQAGHLQRSEHSLDAAKEAVENVLK